LSSAQSSNRLFIREHYFAEGGDRQLRIDHEESSTERFPARRQYARSRRYYLRQEYGRISYRVDSNGGILTIVNNDEPTQVAHINERRFISARDGSRRAMARGGGEQRDRAAGEAITGLDSLGNASEGSALGAVINDGGRIDHECTYEADIRDTVKNAGSTDPGHRYHQRNSVPGEQDRDCPAGLDLVYRRDREYRFRHGLGWRWNPLRINPWDSIGGRRQ